MNNLQHQLTIKYDYKFNYFSHSFLFTPAFLDFFHLS